MIKSQRSRTFYSVQSFLEDCDIAYRVGTEQTFLWVNMTKKVNPADGRFKSAYDMALFNMMHYHGDHVSCAEFIKMLTHRANSDIFKDMSENDSLR